MPPPYGLTPEGFSVKRQEEILADIRAEIAAAPALGANINTDPRSSLGQFVEILGGGLAELWEAAADVQNGGLLLKAEDEQLDAIGQMFNCSRVLARSTTVDVVLNGTPATAIPDDSVIRLVDSGARFLVPAAVIGGGGTVTVTVEAEDAGPIQALAGSAWEIVTPVAGWASVTPNVLDGAVGNLVEENGPFRARILQRRVGGVNSSAAIRNEVLGVADVVECLVIGNRGPGADAEGRPPHSVEVVVRGGLDQAVAEAIFLRNPLSVQTVTTVSAPNQVTATVVDENGDNQTVVFSRADAALIWLEIDYAPKRADFDREAEILQAILDFDGELVIGQTVYPTDITDAIFSAFADKVFRQLTIRMGLSASPPTAAVVPGGRTQLCDFDSSRILITRVP